MMILHPARVWSLPASARLARRGGRQGRAPGISARFLAIRSPSFPLFTPTALSPYTGSRLRRILRFSRTAAGGQARNDMTELI